MLWILGALVVGLVAGAVARAVVPGDDAMGIGGTIVLGLVGSLVGGFIGYALFHKDAANGAFQMSGLLGSFVGAIIVLIAWRAFNGATPCTDHTTPALITPALATPALTRVNGPAGVRPSGNCHPGRRPRSAR